MSYNGTVTCRFCYQSGHNARTCPQKAEAHKRRWKSYSDQITAAQESGDHDTEDAYVTYATNEREQYERMTKTCIETGEKLKRKKTAGASLKKMRCSYCGQRGHTRRTCQNLKNDYAVYQYRTTQTRKEWLARYQATGMGIGSLVSVETWNHGYDGNAEYGRRRLMGMVTEIAWDRIDCVNGEGARVFGIKTNYQLGGGQVSYRGAIEDERLSNIELAIAKDARMPSIEVHPSGAASEPPADWLEIFKPVKEVINPKDERCWSYRYSDDDDIRTAREALEIPACAYAE